MNDLKNIPKTNARRRGVMKGAVATAGAAAVYAAPTIQKVSVAFAATVGSAGNTCYRYSISGQVEAVLSGASAPASTSPSQVVFSGQALDGTVVATGNLTCPLDCPCNTPPNSLNILWGDTNPQFHFTLDSLSESICVQETGAQQPSDVPNTISIVGTGDIKQGGTTIATGVTVTATFNDYGETSQSNKTDTTAITLSKGGTTYLSFTTSQTDPSNLGNYQAFQVNC